MSRRLTGTGVAIVTPFTKEGAVDYNALAKIINHIIEGGCDYIVSLGTTGETATLTKEEKKEIFAFTRKTINGKIGLVAGLGGNNTAELVEAIKEFDATGFDAILSVSPYYNKPSQEGIYQHYMQLAAVSPLPIIIYNVPARTSSNITAETVLRLAEASKKFIAVKEASGMIAQMMQIVHRRPEGFLVISGDDPLTLPGIAFGMDGVISVVANAFPSEVSMLVNSALKGDFIKAQGLHYKLLEITDLMFAEGSPPGVKAVLNTMELCENKLRLPMVPVTQGTYDKIKSATARLTM